MKSIQMIYTHLCGKEAYLHLDILLFLKYMCHLSIKKK